MQCCLGLMWMCTGRSRIAVRYTYDAAEAVQNALFQRRIEVPVKVLSGNLYVRFSGGT